MAMVMTVMPGYLKMLVTDDLAIGLQMRGIGNISRNRYWGTPVPLWVSDDFEAVVCIGSVAQLEELSGVSGIKDLHRESIDNITIPSKQGKGVLRRVEEVFDCWFESGRYVNL